MALSLPRLTIRRVIYFGIAFTAFVIATLVADVRAQVILGGETVATAISDHLHWAVVEFVQTIFLFVPFAATAWWADQRERQGRWVARAAFALLITYFTWTYWSAYQLIPAYLAKHMWTAAILTIGMLPFYTVGVLVLFACGDWIVRTTIGRRKSKPN